MRTKREERVIAREEKAIAVAESFAEMVQRNHQALWFENDEIVDLRNIISAQMSLIMPSSEERFIRYKDNLNIKYVKSTRTMYFDIKGGTGTITYLPYLLDAQLGSEVAAVQNKFRILKLIFSPQTTLRWKRYNV